jgi:hypothetical protein
MGSDEDDWDSHLAAVALAVLPAPVDRATVLREAAQIADALPRPDRYQHTLGEVWEEGAHDAAAELRRLAAEPVSGPGGVVGETRQAEEQADRLICPGPNCDEDVTDYNEDDHVFRKGDERPYCSGECVVAAYRLELKAQQGDAPSTVHGCPPDGSGLTPCCGRTPFELPRTDRISSEATVTCTGPAAVAQPDGEA